MGDRDRDKNLLLGRAAGRRPEVSAGPARAGMEESMPQPGGALSSLYLLDSELSGCLRPFPRLASDR